MSVASRAARERPQRSDLTARIIVAIPAIIFAITIVALGDIFFTLGLIGLGLVCLHELFQMFDKAHPSRLGGFIGVIALSLAAFFGDSTHVMIALVATFPVVFVLTAAQPKGGAPAISVTILGVTWIGLGLAHAILLRDLPHGGAIIVDVLVGTFLGDTGAYLGGRQFGRRKLAPAISPNKTVEGLAIGFVTAIVATWAAGLYQDWLSGTDALILGACVGLAAPVGDLFESYLKRDAGTKDTGTLFGAHGGALDRLDAVLFSIVVGYYVWLALM
ncbi:MULTISPECIES: phosphatidate cytidylyltransferase [Solirubrobacterales]|uniref:phosphatidate cytidylyltransferase n=1 Tax=Solirubrobacterales TaxID=588673 RepID=UPI0012B8EB66|nr:MULTISPECIES: phosphatidate cytidylyltransferase [Solirubrobacterales]